MRTRGPPRRTSAARLPAQELALLAAARVRAGASTESAVRLRPPPARGAAAAASGVEAVAPASRSDVDPRRATHGAAEDVDPSAIAAKAARGTSVSMPVTFELPVDTWEGRPAEAAPLRPSPGREIDAAGERLGDGHGRVLCLVGLSPNDVFHASRLPFVPGSSIAGCAHRAIAVLRGGALEPRASCRTGNSQAKANAYHRAYFQRTCAEGLSLSGGASSRSRFSQAEHHLWVPTLTDRLEQQKGDLSGSPSSGLLCG